jgi:NCAIR mutase (PurE)-related protein
MSDVQIDLSRRERMGFPEIVYGEFKTPDQLRRILAVFREAGQGALVTRLQPEKAVFLEGGSYDAAARTYLAGPGLPARSGLVGIVTGGTSDAPVAAEAAAVLDFLGISRRVWNDLGVSCLDRVLSRLPELRECDVLIAAAGFEGALASVLAGLFPGPVIAVPTSVGYGVAAEGRAALAAMLSSCGNGLLVVNIDNGCGAALGAARILGRKGFHADSQA